MTRRLRLAIIGTAQVVALLAVLSAFGMLPLGRSTAHAGTPLTPHSERTPKADVLGPLAGSLLFPWELDRAWWTPALAGDPAPVSAAAALNDFRESQLATPGGFLGAEVLVTREDSVRTTQPAWFIFWVTGMQTVPDEMHPGQTDQTPSGWVDAVVGKDGVIASSSGRDPSAKPTPSGNTA